MSNFMSKRLAKYRCSEELIALENSLETTIPVITHYTAPSGLLGILNFDDNSKKAKLWFTQFDSLNDKNERLNIEQFLQDYCARKLKWGEINKSFANLICSTKPQNIDFITYPEKKFYPDESDDEYFYVSDSKFEECDTYLCCFSEYPDLLPMWNYYSKSNHYEGYSISLDSWDFESDYQKGYSMNFRKVIYRDSEKNQIWNTIIDPLFQIYKRREKCETDFIKSIIQEFVNMYQLVFKDEAFEHEKEVRIILNVPTTKRKTGIDGVISPRKYRVNNNGFVVPYVEYFFPIENINRITVAPLLESELAQKNLIDMLNYYDAPNIEVASSKIPIRF